MRTVYGDHNYTQLINPVVNGEQKVSGCVPRDFQAMPYGSLPYAGPFAMPLMSDEEIQDMIADQERNKNSLEHIRADHKIFSLDQDGWPYCWAFSTTKCVMLSRAAQNLPMVVLSGWGLGCLAANFQKRGGWCQQSLDKAVNVGIPSLEFWKQGVTRRGDVDMDAALKDAAKYKVTEWFDMGDESRETRARMMATCLLNNVPMMGDYNHMAHSVAVIRVLKWKPTLEVLFDNSWSPSWDGDGMGILSGSKAYPDNAACPVVSKAS